MKKGFLTVFVVPGVLLIFAVTGAIFFLEKINSRDEKSTNYQKNPAAVSTHTPSPFVFQSYSPPKIERKNVYTIFLVGDSMTYALGPHGGTFNTFMNNLYKNQNIGILVDNYAQGAKNILSLGEMMTTRTTFWDSTFEPLLQREFDLILIESFGYNPLSQFGQEEGLKKQTQALDEVMTTLVTTRKHAAIVFVATIAPNKENYAKKVILDIPLDDRIKQANERSAYIENHINYARTHNIPIINVYEKSQNSFGDGDLKYIDTHDYIHPSFEGVDLIGHEIANFIYENQILPR